MNSLFNISCTLGLGLSLCLSSANLHLSAVEEQLQQGPEIMLGRLGIETAHVDKGIYRSKEPVLNGLIHNRWQNVGLTLEAWMALQEDDTHLVSSGELTGINARMDYLYEVDDFFQIIPHLEADFYPSLPSSVKEPTWLGADFWYLLPWEGTELGFSLDTDLTGENGTFGSFAARQLFQHAPYDILAWQSLNFGSSDFHRAYSGDDSSSLTTLELGVELTLPMPWEKTWLVFNAEYSYWLMGDDRAMISDDSTFLLGVSFLYRQPKP